MRITFAGAAGRPARCDRPALHVPFAATQQARWVAAFDV
jgi:hypothetical protein